MACSALQLIATQRATGVLDLAIDGACRVARLGARDGRAGRALQIQHVRRVVPRILIVKNGPLGHQLERTHLRPRPENSRATRPALVPERERAVLLSTRVEFIMNR